MKKSILNLRGAQELSKNEQKSVSGGRTFCMQKYCAGTCCLNGCFPLGFSCSSIPDSI